MKIMTTRRVVRLAAIVVPLGLAEIGYLFLAVHGSVGELVDVFTSIGSIAGLVFTVAGLWAGFVFPEAIASMVSNDSAKVRAEKAIKYKNILQPVLMALACVIATGLVPIARNILRAFHFSPEISQDVKIAAALIAVLLTFALGWSILKVINPSISYYRRIWHRAESEQLADDHMPQEDAVTR